MKKLIFTLLFVLSASHQAGALDLEVYGGKVLASRNYGLASSENPQYLAGIKAEENFMWQRLKLFTDVQTLMDGRTQNGLAQGANGFHPTSVNYGAGAELNVYAGVGLRVTHNCWHAVNSGWADTQQWTNAELFYRFSNVGK